MSMTEPRGAFLQPACGGYGVVTELHVMGWEGDGQPATLAHTEMEYGMYPLSACLPHGQLYTSEAVHRGQSSQGERCYGGV